MYGIGAVPGHFRPPVAFAPQYRVVVFSKTSTTAPAVHPGGLPSFSNRNLLEQKLRLRRAYGTPVGEHGNERQSQPARRRAPTLNMRLNSRSVPFAIIALRWESIRSGADPARVATSSDSVCRSSADGAASRESFRKHLSFLDAGIDCKGTLLASGQQSSCWTLIVDRIYCPACHNNVYRTEPPRRRRCAKPCRIG
jgi:hypothetical protein